MRLQSLVFVCGAALAASAFGQIRITEWAYQGPGSEFIEFTNVGPSPVSMLTYSFSDANPVPGEVSLAGFVTLAPGESGILTDAASAAAFRTLWNLPSTVKVIAGNGANLSRADEINVFDGLTLVDTLTYDDETGMGPRTNTRSGVTHWSNYGTNNASAWVLASAGDAFGSFQIGSAVGSPGFAVIPTPGAATLMGIGGLAMVRRRR